MLRFTAPGIGRESNTVRIELTVPDEADGVLHALGGSGGGVIIYMDKDHLVYLYNMFIIEQYEAQSRSQIAAGRHTIEIVTDIVGPGKAGRAVLPVEGKQVCEAELNALFSTQSHR